MFRTGTINGHTAFWMENKYAQISILPEKGCDIYEWIYKPLNMDLLIKTPSGLKPPSDVRPTHFLENYEGAWQELFPNANMECSYRGNSIPFHGEVALLPWTYDVVANNSCETIVKCSVTCQKTPFHIDKILILHEDQAVFTIEETITNTSDQREYFICGQHIVLGANFLEGGCKIKTDATVVETPDTISEVTARLMPAKQTKYPFAIDRHSSELIDLSQVLSPDAHTHDDAFITGFSTGKIEVNNPLKKVCVSLEWDLSMFPWMVLWQPYGGADEAPLTGTYGLGIEPWVSRYNLADSIKRNCAASLDPQATMCSTFKLTVAQS